MDEYYSDEDGDPVCDDCRSEYYVWCVDCENLVHIDNAYRDEDDGEYRCEHCHAQHSSGQIHSYGYKPAPLFKGEARTSASRLRPTAAARARSRGSAARGSGTSCTTRATAP